MSYLTLRELVQCMESKNIPSQGYVLDIINFVYLYFHYIMFLRNLESFVGIVNRLLSNMFMLVQY